KPYKNSERQVNCISQLDDSVNCVSQMNSDNITYVGYYLHQPSVAAVFIVSYLLIFLVCMVGNGVVCFIVLRSKNMRTVTNLFILNLAISDLLVGIFCMPTTLLDNIITGWPFGSMVCKMSGMVQGISVSASVFTLVAIAVDSKHTLVTTRTSARFSQGGFWTSQVDIVWPKACAVTFIMVSHSAQFLHQPQLRTTLVFWHVWPSIMALICLHAAKGFHAPPERKVRVRGKVIAASHCAPRNQSTSRDHDLLFILSWLPLWTLMMLTDYVKLTEHQYKLINIYIYPFAHWLAFFNSSVNPIIYGFFNENFRRGFQAVFKFGLCPVGGQHRTYSHRVQGNSVQPVNQQPSTEPISLNSLENNSSRRMNHVNEQDLVMEDLEKVNGINYINDINGNPTAGSKQINCWVCPYFNQHLVVFNPAFFRV
uniref:Neuropeptide FF receptor 2 n=1 Tax=Sinocyclocheilus grahami TaxID=75366 RepID=A0A672NGX5_SINGR